MRETLCWYCAKATDGNKCPWAYGKEVDGWTAEETIIDNDGDMTSSYCVIDCPLYEEDYKHITLADLAQLIGKTQGVSIREAKQICKAKGYDLRVCKEQDGGNTYISCYIKAIRLGAGQ